MAPESDEVLLGVLSDTHGSIAQPVLDALSAAEHIIHAGDVGADETLLLLESIAPLTAVRGNTDNWGLAARLPSSSRLNLNGWTILVQHRPFLLAEKMSARAELLVHGHLHQRVLLQEPGFTVLCPGAATAAAGSGASVAMVRLPQRRDVKDPAGLTVEFVDV